MDYDCSLRRIVYLMQCPCSCFDWQSFPEPWHIWAKFWIIKSCLFVPFSNYVTFYTNSTENGPDHLLVRLLLLTNLVGKGQPFSHWFGNLNAMSWILSLSFSWIRAQSLRCIACPCHYLTNSLTDVVGTSFIWLWPTQNFLTLFLLLLLRLVSKRVWQQLENMVLSQFGGSYLQ